MNDKIIKIDKNKNIENLFRKNKTSPLLKTPEKTFTRYGSMFNTYFNIYKGCHIKSDFQDEALLQQDGSRVAA